MNTKLFEFTSQRPELYQESTAKFWDDEHISKGMLAAHLDPLSDPASRNHKFIDTSVDWIAGVAPVEGYPDLLDLGCGPGLYCERFSKLGYHVTGIDLSKRSLTYAKSIAEQEELPIKYLNKNYLTLSDQESFDIITLIYCDFSVFSEENRRELLSRIYRALKPKGKFIVDVFSVKTYEGRQESKDWDYFTTGFWYDKPHICLNSHYLYDETHTKLNQTIVIAENTVECYNLWDHTFTPEELIKELKHAGFETVDIYGDVAGAEYTQDSEIICAVATKGTIES